MTFYLRFTAEVVDENGKAHAGMIGVASFDELMQSKFTAPVAVDQAAIAVARHVWDGAVLMGLAGD